VDLGEGHPRSKYIIAAGPMSPEFYGPETRDRFYQMIVENNVRVVVSLARFEPGVEGCSDFLQHGAKYGDSRISVSSISSVSDGTPYEKRLIHVTNEKTQQEPEHCVVHFAYPHFPNYGVPTELSSLRQLITDVDAEANFTPHDSPILVHCSGGVGRSGSFLTALHVWKCLREVPCDRRTEEQIELGALKSIYHLRTQRHPWCVEHEEQAQYVRQVLLSLLQ